MMLASHIVVTSHDIQYSCVLPVLSAGNTMTSIVLSNLQNRANVCLPVNIGIWAIRRNVGFYNFCS